MRSHAEKDALELLIKIFTHNMNDGEEMINSACERIKELENELAEVKVAYEGMKSQRDNLKLSIEDALRWIECDTRGYTQESEFNALRLSLDYLEKILKEYLK